MSRKEALHAPPADVAYPSAEEAGELRRLVQGRKIEVRLRDRARICRLAHQGRRVPQIATELGICEATVRRWITRFNTAGLDGLCDADRTGRPPRYTSAQVGTVIETSLTKPTELGLPFACWTLDRLEAYLNETKGVPI